MFCAFRRKYTSQGADLFIERMRNTISYKLEYSIDHPANSVIFPMFQNLVQHDLQLVELAQEGYFGLVVQNRLK